LLILSVVSLHSFAGTLTINVKNFTENKRFYFSQAYPITPNTYMSTPETSIGPRKMVYSYLVLSNKQNKAPSGLLEFSTVPKTRPSNGTCTINVYDNEVYFDCINGCVCTKMSTLISGTNTTINIGLQYADSLMPSPFEMNQGVEVNQFSFPRRTENLEPLAVTAPSKTRASCYYKSTSSAY
jgi:hypothetical protein